MLMRTVGKNQLTVEPRYNEVRGGGVLPYITYTGMCRPTGSQRVSISEAFSRTGYNISNARKLQFCKQPFEIIYLIVADYEEAFI